MSLLSTLSVTPVLAEKKRGAERSHQCCQLGLQLGRKWPQHQPGPEAGGEGSQRAQGLSQCLPFSLFGDNWCYSL